MRFDGPGIVALAVGLAAACALVIGVAVAAQDVPPEDDRGDWVRIGELDLGRADHTSTLLPDGTILVAGGTSAAGRPVLTAELVYPQSGATRPAGTLPWGLAGHQAVALPDGRVVLSGSDGYAAGERLADEDICAIYPPLLWDPATSDFRPILTVGDSNGSSATALPDGRVLFAGGETACIWGQSLAGLNGARTWDPLTGEVVGAGSLNAPRAFGPSVLLDDGRVLVGGGVRLADLPAGASVQHSGSLEAWDPDTDTWSDYGRVGLGIDRLFVLDDGVVGVVGELDDGYGMRLFDPGRGELLPISEAQARPLRGAAVAGLDGRIVFVGGLNKSDRPVPQALLWQPATGDRERLRYPRSGADTGHTATALGDGVIVVIGGRDAHDDGRVVSAVEALRPAPQPS
ncbi:MAG: kelch repeat-containing protein [Candidatus Limnocylindrales bacterium]